ncbi:MAG: FKBP-type peptidyl-prolyl cis-trans isomerase [Verrucomicrobiia bacterium]
MKTIAFAVIVSLGIAGLAGCASHGKTSATSSATQSATPAVAIAPASPTDGTNVLSDEKARVSYAIGMTFAHNFKMQDVEVDPDLLARGLKDAQSGGTTLLTSDQMRDTLGEFQKSLAAKQRVLREAAAAKNKVEGEAFLATNKSNPGVITLPDGLQYMVITNGSGAMPLSNDVVTVNYRGTLLDGTEFDSSYKRGHPAQFPVGNVIHGWTEALLQMNVGSKWKLFIPAQLAYGEQNRPGITPNSLLIFEVELVGAEHPKPPAPITSDIVKVPSLDEMKKGAKIEVIKPEDAEKAQAAQTNAPAK